MIQNIQTPAEVEQDLHIAKHIAPEELPAMIQPVMALAKSDAEKDILLLSLLTAAGSCMPNLYFRYGLTGKRYYPNLQCFVVGSAASGKGIANLALELVSKVHEALPLVIAGDSSYAGFYRQLARQDGRGYIHESEGSVITDVWRSSVANYNTALRKAAEHEPITRNRANDSSSIDCPQLSVLLTGTFSQYKALVPSIENGYFSRLLTLIVQEHQAFNSEYVEPGTALNSIMLTATKQLFGIYERLFASQKTEFSLTAEQRARLGKHMETAYPTLMQLLGENFHSVVLRMAVNIERMAMILSVLRGNFSECTDTDYATAELIGNKLLLHMGMAYRMIHGKEQVAVPKIQAIDQRKMLLSLLPEEFDVQKLVAEAKMQGLSHRTATRWNENWQQQGLVQKVQHGLYRKSPACA